MTASNRQEDHVLPRPVRPLPDYPLAKARANAAEKLIETFGLSAAAAACVADAAVDPADLRKAIDHPLRAAVPGGHLSLLRFDAWTRRVMPDPRNPRLGPKRRHPFAVDPGTDEESRFAPVADPTSDGLTPELTVEVESREHLTWASVQAKLHVLDMNDWRDSIRAQGVMTPVQLVPTRYTFGDGSPALVAMTTAEGSSRITSAHAILEIATLDSMYDANDRFMRAHIKRLNEAIERGNTQPKDSQQLRCERVPAEVIVGFEPDPGVTSDFALAVKSLVALRHVDPPKEWGEGPENEALADGCLLELERRGVIPTSKRRWLAGSLTKKEATASHLSPDPAIRAAEIVRVFTSENPEIRAALRVAVTAQSTRKRLKSKLLTRLAAALIMRGHSGETTKLDRIRKALQDAYGDAVRGPGWSATQRSADELLERALEEDADTDHNDPLGAARLELAARAALPLVAKGALYGDRGAVGSNQPDRREPGIVIDAMAKQAHGLRQLHRALVDFGNGEPIRVIDEAGKFVRGTDGQELKLSDYHLRVTYSAAGDVHQPSSVITADEQLAAALAEFGKAVRSLTAAKEAAQAVVGAGGEALVDARGVTTVHTKEWRDRLREIDDALAEWGITYRRKHKSSGTVPTHMDADDYETPDEDRDEDDDSDDDEHESAAAS